MRLPSIEGIIRRRLLVNFRVDPAVLARELPTGMAPKLHDGHAVAGICLIRLETIRPEGLPLPCGLSSENAAHRIAVTAPDGSDAVFIPRRDSDSWLNQAAGGRLFPGRHHRARFEIEDDGNAVRLAMRSADGEVSLRVEGHQASALPPDSIFASLDDASRFFERGALGYSSTTKPGCYDGILLETKGWSVEPFAISNVASSYFDDTTRFPEGSVAFDHALVMRDLQHAWHPVSELRAG